MGINISGAEIVSYCGEAYYLEHIKDCFAQQHTYVNAAKLQQSATVFLFGAAVLATLVFIMWLRTERLKKKLREQHGGKNGY